MSSRASLQDRGTAKADFDPIGVVVFYLVTLLLSWGWTIPMVLAGWTIEKGDAWPTHFPALAGPLIAAVAVTAWRTKSASTKALFGRMVAWRAPGRVWLGAISPAIFLALALLVMLVGGQDLPRFADFGLFSGLPAGVLGVVLLVTLVNGFGEETGWRGFALPELQRRFSPATATLLVAGMWALWHVPYFFVLAAYEDLGGGELVGFALGIVAGAFVLTWLYNRSGGSVLLPVIWHGIYNVVGATAAATGIIAAAVTTLVMVHGFLLIGLEVRARRGGRPTVIGPRREA
jgi:membrane protease YdiL (CAAX protease family)